MNRSFLFYIENGHNNFSVDMLPRICMALEIEPKDLLS